MVNNKKCLCAFSNMRLSRFIAFIMFLSLFGLFGCAANLSGVNQKAHSEDAVADRCMEQILDAIQNKDQEALKALFSKEALETIDEASMNQKMTELFDLFTGEITGFEGELSTKTINHTDEHSHKITGFYRIDSTEGPYHLLFIYQDKYEENSDAVGLSMIVFVSDALFNSDGFYWNYGSREPGIYIDL